MTHRQSKGSASPGFPYDEAMVTESYVGQVRAPEFPERLDWLNVSRPLSIQDLRGRLAIIDFWTFC